MPRTFAPIALSVGATIELPSASAHHVREALRLRVGDTLTVFNGHGGEFRCRLTAITRQAVAVMIAEFAAIERESPLTITLAQGISRGEKMDYTLQKAVELGVTRLVPLTSARSQIKLDAERAARRMEHWRGIITHACEQCGRNRVPELLAPMTVAEFVAIDTASTRLTLAPGSAMTLVSLAKPDLNASLVVGPEGGLSASELAVLEAHQYQGVRLGPRVLRTETAALVALATLQAIAGDLR